MSSGEPEQSIGGSSSEDDAGSKFTLAACHDSTLAAIVASLGTMEGELNTWPSYASCLAVELFESSSLEGRELTRRYHQGQASSSSSSPSSS